MTDNWRAPEPGEPDGLGELKTDMQKISILSTIEKQIAFTNNSTARIWNRAKI